MSEMSERGSNYRLSPRIHDTSQQVFSLTITENKSDIVSNEPSKLCHRCSLGREKDLVDELTSSQVATISHLVGRVIQQSIVPKA